MRILIAVLILLLISSTSMAMDGSIGFSWQDGNARAFPDGGIDRWNTDIELGQRFKSGIRPFTHIKTLISGWDSEYNSFTPTSVIYDLGVEYDYGGLNFKIEHSCWHPIDSIGNVEEFNKIGIIYSFGSK